jgi:YD repeat-containing protein
VTDQASKKRRGVTDALGRLSSVVEDPDGLPYTTSHTYDGADNLRTVTQGGQTRTFVYDSLKRLTSATNPESGVVGYTYDDNGNLLESTEI